MVSPRILYVGGLGRSGSTLLERSLAQLPGACGVGESVYMWERGLLNDERCGCGASFSKCSFWRDVGVHGFGGWANVDPARVAHLRSRVDDVKFVPAMLAGLTNTSFDRDARDYVDYYERLYRGVRLASGADFIIDSSKITSLAYLLARYADLDLSLAHILRDPRAVAYAWTKVVRRPEVTTRTAYMPRYSPTYMAFLYSGHHVLLEALRLRGVKVFNVRYEDFAEAPVPTLERVANFAGIPWEDSRVAGGSPGVLRLDVVHTASGNPSRFRSGDTEVRRDDSWRLKLPRAKSFAVASVAAPLMVAYGYARRVEAPVRASETTASVSNATSTDEGRSFPPIAVVVPTHNRPQMLRRAVRSVLAQNYSGPLTVIVVYDKSEPDPSVAALSTPHRQVQVMRNDMRTPGLAGARNTGILAADATWVAFLDDDDHWVADKLAKQMRALGERPGAVMATTGMIVERDGQEIVRLAQRDTVHHVDLIRSRLAMLHSSSFVLSRSALLGEVGLVDETIPRSMAEDWDLLLRASRVSPVVNVDEPLVRVTWGATSYFADQWRTRNEARMWMIEHHPELLADPKGAGLTYGKLAFGSAILGDRSAAWRWMRRALRANWQEPRTPLAALVAAGAVDGNWIVEQLARRGRGI